MKKLMIAAIAACTVGAAFAESSCEVVDKRYCAYAYRIKLAGKTVKGKELAATSACSIGACWAKPASFRIAGYIYNDGSDQADATCDCECPCEGHWDLTDNSAVFWNGDKVQVFADVASVEFDVFDVLRNGGAKNKVQLGIKIKDLYLAGFGDYNPESGRVKRANGFFAGTIDAPACESVDGATCEVTSDTAQVFKPCDLATSVDCDKAIAYGRWAMAWKADKVTLLNSGKDPLEVGVCVPLQFKKAE